MTILLMVSRPAHGLVLLAALALGFKPLVTLFGAIRIFIADAAPVSVVGTLRTLGAVLKCRFVY